jgi:hypothetical protein
VQKAIRVTRVILEKLGQRGQLDLKALLDPPDHRVLKVFRVPLALLELLTKQLLTAVTPSYDRIGL